MQTNQNLEKFIIYGAGGHARELRAQMELEGYEVIAFVDDLNPDRAIDGTPVIHLTDPLSSSQSISWLVGIGDNATRKKIYESLKASGRKIGTFVSRYAHVTRNTKIGEGAQIFAGCIVSDNVSVGINTVLLFGSVISHDSVIGDHCFVAANSTIAGWVRCASQVWVEIGGIISHGTSSNMLIIGEGAVIGAGACVIRSVLAGTTVVGVPATPLNKRILQKKDIL